MDRYLDLLIIAVDGWARDAMRNRVSLSPFEQRLFDAYLIYKNKENRKLPEVKRHTKTLPQPFDKAVTVPAPEGYIEDIIGSELILDLVKR